MPRPRGRALEAIAMARRTANRRLACGIRIALAREIRIAHLAQDQNVGRGR